MPHATPDFFKPSNVARSFFIDWRKNLVKSWGPERRYNIGDVVRAPTGTGFYYRVTVTGISSRLQPDFSIVPTTFLTDGSVTWETFHSDDAGLFTLSTSVWSVDPGITVVSDAISGFLTEIKLDDGTPGEIYRATNDIVTSVGVEAQDDIIIEIEDPPSV